MALGDLGLYVESTAQSDTRLNGPAVMPVRLFYHGRPQTWVAQMSVAMTLTSLKVARKSLSD